MRILAACHLLLLGIGACLATWAETDHRARPGEWLPLGAHAADLRSMATDPHDLDMGPVAASSDGGGAAPAAASDR